MHLRSGERILKIYRHHPTPFVVKLLKVSFIVFPFFFLLFLFRTSLPTMIFFWLNIVMFFVYALLVSYSSLIYWLDRLVVTDQRIVHIDWQYLTVRNESEAELNDIQDIKTGEKGFLSYFYVFDYGFFALSTASAKVIITFLDAPDPEGIRKFIYHIKPQ